MALIETYITEPAMLVVVMIVFVTGIVRGFSGFGSGMIIGPSSAAFFGPQIALAMITIIDLIPTVTLVWPARKNVVWRELLPIVVGFSALAPLGIWVLKTGDVTALRWFISISILFAVAILWSGYKYKGPRSGPISFAFGGASGFMGAAAALPGPSVLIYWLASDAKSITVRANMIFFLFATDLIVISGYIVSNIYTYEAMVRALICAPGYFVGIEIGKRFFNSAGEATYRNVAFAIILAAAISSLPLLDHILR